MNYLVSAIIVIWLVAALFLLFALLVFTKNFKQSKQYEKIFFDSLKNESEEKAIKKGRDYILSLPFEEVHILGADEIPLYGKLYCPENGEGEKTVLLLHSFGSSGEIDFAKIFSFYREKNFNILIADERACGKSGGKYSSLGVAEGYDAVMWCSWLELRFGTGCEIFMHGIKEGALAAAFAGTRADLPKNVKGFIAQEPITNIYSFIEEKVKSSYGFLCGILMPIINMFCRLHIGFDLREFSLFDCIGKIKTDALFICKDQKDTFDNFKESFKILNLKDSVYSKNSQEEIEKNIAEFIGKSNG